jgi:hypothetical protein
MCFARLSNEFVIIFTLNQMTLFCEYFNVAKGKVVFTADMTGLQTFINVGL